MYSFESESLDADRPQNSEDEQMDRTDALEMNESGNESDSQDHQEVEDPSYAPGSQDVSDEDEEIGARKTRAEPRLKLVERGICRMQTGYRPISYTFLQSALLDLATSHNYPRFNQLFTNITLDKRISHEILKNCTLLCIKTRIREERHELMTLEGLKPIFSNLIFLNTNTYELLLEFTMLMLSRQRTEQVSFIEGRLRQREVLSASYPGPPLISDLTVCYVLLFNYLEWIECVRYGTELSELEYSGRFQLHTSAITANLQQVVRNSSSTMDFFLLKIVEVLTFTEKIDDAIDLLMHYAKSHPTHLNSFIYLYKYLNKYCPADVEMNAALNQCFTKLIEFDPSNKLIIELADETNLPTIELAEIVMKYLDYYENREDVNGWMKLLSLLIKLKQLEMEDNSGTHKSNLNGFEKFKTTFDQTYVDYWSEYHFRIDDLDLDDHQVDIDLLYHKTMVANCLDRFSEYQNQIGQKLTQIDGKKVAHLNMLLSMRYPQVQIPTYLAVSTVSDF